MLKKLLKKMMKQKIERVYRVTYKWAGLKERCEKFATEQEILEMRLNPMYQVLYTEEI